MRATCLQELAQHEAEETVSWGRRRGGRARGRLEHKQRWSCVCLRLFQYIDVAVAVTVAVDVARWLTMMLISPTSSSRQCNKDRSCSDRVDGVTMQHMCQHTELVVYMCVAFFSHTVYACVRVRYARAWGSVRACDGYGGAYGLGIRMYVNVLIDVPCVL